MTSKKNVLSKKTVGFTVLESLIVLVILLVLSWVIVALVKHRLSPESEPKGLESTTEVEQFGIETEGVGSEIEQSGPEADQSGAKAEPSVFEMERTGAKAEQSVFEMEQTDPKLPELRISD